MNSRTLCVVSLTALLSTIARGKRMSRQVTIAKYNYFRARYRLTSLRSAEMASVMNATRCVLLVLLSTLTCCTA